VHNRHASVYAFLQPVPRYGRPVASFAWFGAEPLLIGPSSVPEAAGIPEPSARRMRRGFGGLLGTLVADQYGGPQSNGRINSIFCSPRKPTVESRVVMQDMPCIVHPDQMMWSIPGIQDAFTLAWNWAWSQHQRARITREIRPRVVSPRGKHDRAAGPQSMVQNGHRMGHVGRWHAPPS